MPRPQTNGTHSASAETGFAVEPETFRKILQRERMRADRSERPFSVLVFTAEPNGGADGSGRAKALRRGDQTQPCVKPSRAARREFVRLAGYLQSRLRTTDVVGQLDRQRLAVLLFDTDHRGARALLADIQRNCPAVNRQQEAAIHTYPVDSPAESPDSPGQPVTDTTLEILFTRPMPAWKRLADILLATASLVVFSPIMVTAAVMIKLTSPGPILFCQRRAGLAGRPFVVYKFRTMHEGSAARQADLRRHSEQDGPAFKLKNDPRVTWVGKYLRKTCIDEFPQFWNVLRGEMSIVGPRPLPLNESADCVNWQRRRLDVTPGMTCIWQVSGGLRVSFVEWMRMDLRYIRQRTLWHDLTLLLKTARAILFHRASH